MCIGFSIGLRKLIVVRLGILEIEKFTIVAFSHELRELNLDAYSETQAKTKTEESDSTVDHRIRETYTWLLVPGQQEPTAEVTCTAVRVQGQELLAANCRTLGFKTFEFEKE